jgi:hypothetical protein
MAEPSSLDVVCDLGALTERQRTAQLVASVELIVRGRSGIVELPDGFELHFEPAPNRLVELARWVERESVCCAWLDFAILRSPVGPLRLQLRSNTAGAGLEAASALAQGRPIPDALTTPTRSLDALDFARIGASGCAHGCGCSTGAS